MPGVTAKRLARIVAEVSETVDRCGHASAFWQDAHTLIPPGRMKLDDFRVFLAAKPKEFRIERFEDTYRRVYLWVTRDVPGTPAIPAFAKYRLDASSDTRF